MLIRLGARGVQLNSTAAMIWEQCNGNRTRADILAQLCELFNASEDALWNGLAETLNGLIDAGTF